LWKNSAAERLRRVSAWRQYGKDIVSTLVQDIPKRYVPPLYR
jgi:hypothetical protein